MQLVVVIIFKNVAASL